ncbi:MAG TPA: hypothetical protein VGU25_17080 [Acidobacteriaceae bacterium]|nr:hypothetical protein [Acidobacteriaceae bacterium]
MFSTELPNSVETEPTPEAIREQLESLVQDHVFRSSKRSVQFLRYVVEQTLNGAADRIKERTIGVEVFHRDPSYDTNVDHIVRTAAIELRKRLSIYYGDDKHRSELRMVMVPGSYIPHFAYPHSSTDQKEQDFVEGPTADEFSPSEDKKSTHSHPTTVAHNRLIERNSAAFLWSIAALCLLFAAAFLFRSIYKPDPQYLFWKPVLDANGPVLLAVGDVPNGPPTASSTPQGDQGTAIPIVQKASSPTVPFADTVTIARVVGILQARRKEVIIRPESQSSFSDLRQNPAILIGAFNNEWSLRLTQQLRYTLALDPDRHLIYIRDARRPSARDWSWPTDERTRDQGSLGGPALQDYALISRIWDSKTGNVVVVIGGLYTYGTEAAGEALTSRSMMDAISRSAPLNNSHQNIQIVLSTTVTDGTPGPPRVLAVSAE